MLRVQFNTTSDAKVEASASGEPEVQRACQHIMIAFGGEDHGQPRSGERHLRMSRLYFFFYPIKKLTLWALVVLSLFEQPVWVFNHKDPSRALSRKDLYLMAHSFHINRHISLPIEWFLLLCLCAFTALRLYALGTKTYFRRPKALAFFILLALSLLDALVTSICLAFGLRLYRLCAYLRLFMLLINTPSILRQLSLVVRTLPHLTGAALAYVVNLLVFGFFALLLFTGEQRTTIFPNFSESLWNLFVLGTTSNYPDVMMPAYSTHRLAFLFFLGFLLLSFFFLLNLFLAVVIKGHGEQRDADTKALAESEQAHLRTAFALLDPSGRGSVSRALIGEVLGELRHHHVAQISEEREELLFCSLDTDRSATLDENEFLSLCVLLRVRFTKVEGTTELLRAFPALEESAAYQRLYAFVTGRVLEYTIDTLLVVNAIVIIIEATVEGEALRGMFGSALTKTRVVSRGLHTGSTNSTQLAAGATGAAGAAGAAATGVDKEWFDGLEIAFTIIFFVECLVKVIVLGWRRYSRNLKNVFDGCVSVVSLATVVVMLLPNGFHDPVALRRIMALRVLRLLRMLIFVPLLPPIVGTFMRMLPAAGSLMLVMLTTWYFFATLGVQLYGGLINLDPDEPQYAVLRDSEFGEANYWANNFNDILSGMVVCFELIMVNNWMVIADGYVLVTSKWSRFFFIAFYVVGVLIVLNIVTAFALDAFMSVYDEKKLKADEEEEEEDLLPMGDQASKTAASKGASKGESWRMDLKHVPEEQRAIIRQRLMKSASQGDGLKANPAHD